MTIRATVAATNTPYGWASFQTSDGAHFTIDKVETNPDVQLTKTEATGDTMTYAYPNVGDKIRITHEGTVTSVDDSRYAQSSPSRRIRIKAANDRTLTFYAGPSLPTAIEVLQPALETDAVYKDADGEFMRWTGDRWEIFASDYTKAFNYAKLPVTKVS